MKSDVYGLVDYIGLVDWAYKYLSKKPLCKERTRLFKLAGKKHFKKQCQDVDIRKKYSKRCYLLIKRIITKKIDYKQRYANPDLMFSSSGCVLVKIYLNPVAG